MNLKSKFILSRISIAVIVIFSYLQTTHLHMWKWGNGIIYWDTISYYAYLPAVFIHHDLSLEFTKDDPRNGNRYWPETTAEGKKVIKTSSGLAYLYLPFFLAAHLIAPRFGMETDGFSEIYHEYLAFSPLLYFLLGLIFLRKILSAYFSDKVVAATLLAIGLASNLFYYTAVTTISHTYSFGLICMFLYVSIRWIEKPGWLKASIMGLLLGLISLIRPTNAIIAAFPLLFAVQNFDDLWQRILTFLKKPLHLTLIIIGIFMFWIPQFLYWKMQTGHYLYFSYGSDEKFFWSQPVILRGLFGFRKGWLIYSPVMIFAVIGILISLRKLKNWFFPLIFIIPVSLYIMLCWWTWWYGGGFGLRPIIDYYGLLAIPMALTFSQFGKIKPLLKYAGIFFYLIFFYFGIAHQFQVVDGAIHYDSMTWKTYYYNFGHKRMTKEGEKYLESPDYEAAKKGVNR